MSSWEGIDDIVDDGEEFDGSLINIEALEAEHGYCFGQTLSRLRQR